MSGAVAQMGDPQRFQRLAHPFSGFCCRQTQIQRPERHVLTHGGGEQLIIRLLQHQPHPPPPVIQKTAVITDRAAIEQKVAASRSKRAVEMQQQRGFAGAIRAENRQFPAFLNP